MRVDLPPCSHLERYTDIYAQGQTIAIGKITKLILDAPAA